jgi:hypothetical protein
VVGLGLGFVVVARAGHRPGRVGGGVPLRLGLGAAGWLARFVVGVFGRGLVGRLALVARGGRRSPARFLASFSTWKA